MNHIHTYVSLNLILRRRVLLVDDVVVYVVLLLYYRIIIIIVCTLMDGMIMCANTPFCSCTRSEGILC